MSRAGAGAGKQPCSFMYFQTGFVLHDGGTGAFFIYFIFLFGGQGAARQNGWRGRSVQGRCFGGGYIPPVGALSSDARYWRSGTGGTLPIAKDGGGDMCALLRATGLGQSVSLPNLRIRTL